jgi:DNA polymerase-1
MKIRTLLVDSSYLLKRSFLGNKHTYTKSGGHIGGLYSFLTTVRKLIKDHRINKVVLVWDGENGGIHRYHIEAMYKSGRKNKKWHEKIELTEAEIKREQAKEESLLKQRKRIQAYAEELFFRQIEVDEIEADDIIAQYCHDHNKDEDIFIFSNDRDFIQLLDYNITLILGNMPEPITKLNFFMHFPYHYSNSLTMKIICGDDSDDIPNIQGIKERTLLKYFPDLKIKHYSVRDICKRADEINKNRVKEKKKPLKIFENLLNNMERLTINHQLINLKKPFLNEEAVEEMEQLKMPLSDEDRGSKYLYKMMVEDEFLTIYTGTFPNYVEPFYTVIMHEKQILNEYYKTSTF